MPTVYVLNKDGKPLMPTTRCMHVRHLLKNGKARVVKSKPFTIQLLYETDDVVQPLYSYTWVSTLVGPTSALPLSKQTGRRSLLRILRPAIRKSLS